MGTRLELQTKLENLLGSRNVYYQPPTNLSISYPAIVYEHDGYDNKKADDTSYILTKRYSITVIDKKPDNPIIEEMLKWSTASFSTHFKSDGLYHDTIQLYY